MKAQHPAGHEGGGFHGEAAGWKEIVRKYQHPSILRSVWQLTDTLVPYVLLWMLMFFCLHISYWLVVPLVLLASAFLVRTFIIFHDCTHGSFFKSKRANEITGFLTGVLVFTPFHHWRWEHAVHHASSGDLDRRGMGDVWTLTVEEYLNSTRWRRFTYRILRNPVVLFVIAPLLLFLVLQRFPSPKASKRDRLWLHATNLAILIMMAGMAWIFGVVPYLILQLAILLLAGSAGVWLFYVQHQFEDVYWERRPDWDFAKASLEGASFYKLPKVLQWFTGNIGFHHIHHLSPRIPNYELEHAYKSEPMFREVTTLTVRTSLKSLAFRLWDERLHKLTGYQSLKRRRSEQQKDPPPEP